MEEEPNATKMSFWSFGGADWTAERAAESKDESKQFIWISLPSR